MVEAMNMQRRTLIAFLILMATTAGPMGLFQMTGAVDPPISGGTVNGDWIVTTTPGPYTDVDIWVEGNLTVMPGGSLTMTGGNLSVTGNITVLGGGQLTLSSVDVTMNSSSGKEYSVFVVGDATNGTARMTITNGTTFDNNRTTDRPYYFSVTGQSRFRMDHSTIRHMGNTSLTSGLNFTDLLANVNKMGLFLQVSDAIVENNLFSNCSGGPIVTELNLFATGHITPTIVNNTFEDCPLGIVSGYRAQPTLDNNTYRRASVGLYVLLPVLSGLDTIAIRDSTFEDCALGISGVGAPLRITNTDVLRSTVAGIASYSARLFIITYKASIIMDNSSVRDGVNGTYLNSTNLWAYDSDMDGQSTTGFLLGNGSAAELLNTTYDRGKVSFEDGASSFNASWSLRTGTKNESGDPVASSTVDIVDALGTDVAGLTTGADGWAPERIMKEVNIRRDGTVYSTPHNVTALSSDGQLRNITQVNMTGGKQVWLTLRPFDDTPPMITVTAPSNGSFLNKRLVNVTGTAYDNKGLAGISVSFDNGTTWNGATGTSNWNATVDVGKDGAFNITARATDIWGLTAFDDVQVTVDTVPPLLTIIAPANGTLVATSNVNVTVNTSAKRVNIGGEMVDTGPDGNATLNIELLQEGPHIIETWAEDDAYNRAEANVTVIVDLTPPDITMEVQDVYEVAGIMVNGTVFDAISGVDTVKKSMDGVNWSDIVLTDLGSGTFGFNTGFTLVEGDNMLYVKAVDIAGNPYIEMTPVRCAPPDVTPPEVVIALPVEGAVMDPLTFEARGTASDDRGVVTVEWSVDGATWSLAYVVNGTTPGTVIWNANVTVPSRGTKTLMVRAMDAAGNNGSSLVNVTITGDLAPPSVAITYPSMNADIRDELLDVKGTAFDDVGVAYVLVSVNDPDFGANTTNTTVDAMGEWHATVRLVQGYNVIYVKAYDGKGRSSSTDVRVLAKFEVGGGGTDEVKEPPWLPWVTLAFIILLICVVVFGLWAKRHQNEKREEEEERRRKKEKGEMEEEEREKGYEPFMASGKKGGKVEVERMVQLQLVDKADMRKKVLDKRKKRADGGKDYDEGREGSEIPPPKEAWEIKKVTKELDGPSDDGEEGGEEDTGGGRL